MQSELAGKSAIITGATSGMGREVARRFAREGAAIVANGRTHLRANNDL